MPSFDVVSEADMAEVDNAIQNVMREISVRYDFKGSKSSVESSGVDMSGLVGHFL